MERCPPAILKRLLSQMYVLFALNAQKASGYEKKKFCSLFPGINRSKMYYLNQLEAFFFNFYFFILGGGHVDMSLK